MVAAAVVEEDAINLLVATAPVVDVSGFLVTVDVFTVLVLVVAIGDMTGLCGAGVPSRPGMREAAVLVLSTRSAGGLPSMGVVWSVASAAAASGLITALAFVWLLGCDRDVE